MSGVALSTDIKVVVLKADTSKYLARCTSCIPGGVYPDSAFVYATSPKPAYVQFGLEKLDNGKYALRSDTGKYLSRCRDCILGGAYPDSVFIHVSAQALPTSPFAQFDLQQLENGKYTLQADTGKYLSRCNNCIPGGAYSDSVFIHIPQDALPTAPYAQWEIITVQ
jgi:5-hydroxyisourate hydrolase-like protein (transthyretin family)